jgi:hypothetical protein
MTDLLYKAFEKANQLSVIDQQQLASQIIEDIKNEMKWKKTLEHPSLKLHNLAKKTLKEYKAGKTQKLGFDDL